MTCVKIFEKNWRNDMREVSIYVPGKQKETMLVHSIKSSNDIVKALRKRHAIRIDNAQLDIEDNFNEGSMAFFDAITGSYILTAMW